MHITDHAFQRLQERLGKDIYIDYVTKAFHNGKEPPEDYLIKKVLNSEKWSLFNIYRFYHGHLFVFKKEHKKIKLITII